MCLLLYLKNVSEGCRILNELGIILLFLLQQLRTQLSFGGRFERWAPNMLEGGIAVGLPLAQQNTKVEVSLP